jgi:nucleoid-associated protein YgaU
MKLEKLKIKPLSPSKLKEIEVLFNPNSYSITKSVTWSSAARSTASSSSTQTEVMKNAPTLSFGGGGSRQLTLELFFDVTESISTIGDVRKKTNEIVALTRIERKQARPPVCSVSWGGQGPTGSDFPFVGVVSQLTQRFTLFRADGSPVRANLTVVFTEFLNPEDDKRETDPELTTRLVKRGDSLSGMAAEVYRDPTRWRLIAEANDLDDPRHLPIGLRLNVPKIG